MPEPVPDVAPKSPSAEELPKMPTDFQAEVQKGVDLKHSAETEEKIVLPSAEDVKQEKTHNEIIDGVEGFDKNRLSHCETTEKVVLPSANDVKQEKTHNAMVDGVESFDKESLAHCETEEKLPLPSKEDIQVEKQHQEFISGVENFNKDELKHTKTEEKFIMPKDEVARDKVRDLAAKFDHSKLKKAETKETTAVTVIDDKA